MSTVLTGREVLRVATSHCIACGKPTPEKVIAARVIRDLPENARFGGRLRIVQCRRCGLKYLNPMPDPRDLAAIYDFEVYGDSTNANRVLMEHFFTTMRRHLPGVRRVIEIGCGTGDFLGFLEARGLECQGVEFGVQDAGRKRFRGPIHYGRMEDIEIPSGSVDCVLLLNVVEHLLDPITVLAKIHNMLKPGGILLLRHPNARLFTFAPYRYTIELLKFGVHLALQAANRTTGFTIMGFQNQHLFYFDRTTLTALLHRARFDVREVSTDDPFNAQRMRVAWKARNPEAIIAGVRHLLGRYGLGPELLTVAFRK
jgi:SAM-dependent methyltransferase